MGGSGITIRPAHPGDAADITRIHGDAIRRTPSVADHYDAASITAWSHGIDSDERRERLAGSIAEGRHRFVVAEVAGEVVGFGAVAPEEGELRAVYVSSDHGGQGIGTLLLEGLESVALAAGCRHLTLDASLNAEAFYRKHGYIAIGRSTHAFKSGGEIVCVRMEKQLGERATEDGQ